MSDLPPVDPTGEEPPPEDPTVTEDPEFLALVDRLSPYFGDIAAAAAQAAIDNTPVPTIKPGVVQGVGSDRTCSVLIDGDTAPITAQIICENPYVNARVLVEFVPPSAVFVIGFASQGVMPPGLIQPYSGAISIQAGAANTSGGQTTGEPPGGWLWCTGGTVSRATYAALFAVIGTTFGAGDGATTFTLPDLRGRGIFGIDAMGGSAANRITANNTLAAVSGSQTHTIGSANLPTHTHGLNSHVHSLNSHSHSLNSHVHSLNSHSHTISGDGAHSHGLSAIKYAAGGGSAPVVGTAADYTASISESTDGTGNHSHGGGTGNASGDTGGASGDTGNATGDTGGASGSTTDGGFANNSINQLPPYMALHWLIKT